MNGLNIGLTIVLAALIAGGVGYLASERRRPSAEPPAHPSPGPAETGQAIVDAFERIVESFTSALETVTAPPPPVAVIDEQPTGWYDDLVMDVVIVHTAEGLSFEGLLVLVHPKGVLLRNALLLDEKRSPTPMAGELRIAKEKILGVQTKPVELEALPTSA